MKKEMSYLVIHCTGTPEYREVSSAELRRWHTAAPPVGRGWSQVGYTDMIHLDGRVERLVPNNEDEWVDSWEVTNGTKGHNMVSRHVVYVGGLATDGKTPKDTRTVAQRRVMAEYVRVFKLKHPGVRVVGHNELDRSKACPSFRVEE